MCARFSECFLLSFVDVGFLYRLLDFLCGSLLCFASVFVFGVRSALGVVLMLVLASCVTCCALFSVLLWALVAFCVCLFFLHICFPRVTF